MSGHPEFSVTPGGGNRPGTSVLHLNGKLDIFSADALFGEVSAQSAPTVILVLTNVPFIDASGKGALVRILKKQNEAARRLVLVDLRPQVIAELDRSRLTPLFDIVSTLDDVHA